MSDKHHPHVLPLSTYLSVGTALLVLTGITVWAAQYHFGEWNLIVAMTVAVIKATLVLLFFMHLKYDKKVYALVFIVSIIFLAIFISFTMMDTMERDEYGRGSIDKQVPYKAAPHHGEGEPTTTHDSTAAGHDSTAVKHDSTSAGASSAPSGSPSHSTDSVKTESHK